MTKATSKTKKPVKADSAKARATKEAKTLKPSRHLEEEKIVTVPEEVAIEVEGGVSDKNGKKEKYFQAVGRRKESVAIVRLYTKKSTDAIEGDHALVRVNDKDYREYFSDANLQGVVESALRKLKSLNRFKATVKVSGGGLAGQAGAIKHGLSRTLTLFDLNFRKKLKKSGFLTRDSRTKERRKYGLKKARKSGQWSKR
ncbi:MAG: 30S ribosomal protein S9 [Candidatus Yanofskybacteria bacterium]|nr:30S ribosomal protein S9 [Candidatus Yanofskybacteria bacterium]